MSEAVTATPRRARRFSTGGLWGIALLCLAAIVLAGLAAAPFAWRHTAQTALAGKQLDARLIEAKLKAAKNAPQGTLTADDDVSPLFVAGTTPGLALATLQAIATDLAADHGMAIERVESLQTDTVDGLTVLRMEVQASGNIKGLRGYLLAIEATVPLIFVNEARVTAPAHPSEDGTLPSDALTVNLQIEAYGQQEAAK